MERLARKVLLIGWDGADWKMITRLIDAGVMPSLERFVNQGVMGKLATLEPPFSPMLWTSIATGKLADKHGILGFSEPTPERIGIRPVASTSRKVKAIWNILTQRGLNTHVVGWWPSHPAEPIRGVCVSNHYQRANKPLNEPWPMLPGTVHPPELAPLFAWLRVHPGELTAEHILPFVPDAASIHQEKDKHLDSLARIIADTATIHAAATWILENEPWDFAAVYYDAIDHFSHGFMNFHPPKMPGIPEDLFELYHDVVSGGYRFHDMLLGRLLELAGDDATVMLISDHGFHSDHLRPAFIPREPAGPAYQHHPYGIFCLKGEHIRQDELVFGASLLDIAPTLLTLFGLPVGADMDGKPLAQVFDRPVTIEQIPSWEDAPGECGMHPREFIENPYDAQAALQQLVELGYIEAPGENMQQAVERTVREANYNLARVYIGSNRARLAIPLLKELFAAAPAESRFAVRLARCYSDTGNFEDARRVIEKFREEAARQQEILRETLTKLPQDEPAAPAHDDAENERFADESALEADAPERCYRPEQERPADVPQAGETPRQTRRDLAHQLQQIRAAFAQCDLLEGDMLLQEGHPKKALRKYQELESNLPSVKPINLQIGNAYLRLRYWKKAEKMFEKALAIDEDNPQAHYGLCVAYLRQNAYELAIEEALATIGLRYHFPQAHQALGEALAGSGDAVHAAEAFEVCLKLSPEFGQARNALIRLYEQELRQPERAAAHRAYFEERHAMPPLRDEREIDEAAEKACIPPAQAEQTERALTPPIVIVSGLPRSGTSMMMQMLANAGMPLFTDDARQADESNPRGYFEHEAVKRLGRDRSWLKEAQGKAVKIIAPLLFSLPARYAYKIIFMLRDVQEVVQSQRSMLARQGKLTENAPTAAALARAYRRQVLKVMRWAERQHHLSMLYLNYADVIQSPLAQAERVSQFLNNALLPAAMAAVVESDLYREHAAPQSDGSR